MRSSNSEGLNRKLLTFFNSISSISCWDIVFDLSAISLGDRVGAILSPRLMLFILSNYSKYSTTESSTFSMPSIKTKTPILSELIFYLATKFEIFSETPARVLLSIFLSSEYMHMQMARSIPLAYFMSVRILSWLFFFISSKDEFRVTSTTSNSSYLLL